MLDIPDSYQQIKNTVASYVPAYINACTFVNYDPVAMYISVEFLQYVIKYICRAASILPPKLLEYRKAQAKSKILA